MLSHILAPALARRGIHYGWAMVAVTFLTALCTATALSIPGVLLVPLRTEFGWATSAVSAPFGLRILLFGMMGPFAAALMQRYGLRATISTSLVLVMIGLGLATRVHALWQVWLNWGVLIGLGTGMTAMVLGATVASRWFTARRGLVLGLLGASTATGTLAFLPVAAWLTETYGWRLAVVPAMIAAAVCLVLVLLVVCDHPAELGLAPYGETEVRPVPARAASGNAIRLSFEALSIASHSRVFWVLFGTFLICGLSTNGLVGQHFIPLCHDFGMPEVAAASVLAIMGVCDFFGTIGSGYLSDRFDNRWLLACYYGFRGLSLIWLTFSNFSIYGLSLFAVFFGLDFIATVPPTVRMAAQEFGRERAGLVFGWLFFAHQLGGAIAALGAGVSRDVLSSYLPAFFSAGVICLVAAASFALLRKAAPVSVAAAH